MGLYEDAVALANHHFVGRRDEISQFRDVLGAADGRIWWIFGPGGIGKSRLLSVLAGEAEKAGCRVVNADLRSTDGSRGQLAAIGDEVACGGPGRVVAVLDAVDSVEAIEDWLEADFLPRLPSGTVVVLASRQTPSVHWRSSPIWSAILEMVPVRALPPADAQQLLALFGVPSDVAPQLAELAHGHPLALQLLADAVGDGSDSTVPDALDETPDLVANMLAHLVADVPDEAHRSAVEVAAVARATTRGLIREVTGPDCADAIYDWLTRRPWIDRIPGGVCPHDLARDVINVDLRSNDPDRYRTTFEAVRNHVLAPERLADDPIRAAHDYLYMHRFQSAMRQAWDWSSFGRTDATPFHPDDRDVMAELVGDCYGPATVPVLDHWLMRQPQGFVVLRSSDGVVGFASVFVIDEPTDEDLRADPSLAAVWDRARVRGRPRGGETMGFFRFVCDRHAGTLPPSPTYNAVTVHAGAYWFTTPTLSLDYIIKPKDGSFKPMMDYIGFHSVPDAHHVVGDREMVVFEHDWRERPRPQWLARFEALERGGTPDIPVDSAPQLIALDEADFADAVRATLRDFTRPDQLATNPLVASRVVRDAAACGSEGGPPALTETVRQAFAVLDDHPKTDRARRAVDRTYLRGAVTQEAAAEVLDMAFSTYRRHLATGIDLLVDQLWQWELYGRDGSR